MQFLLEFLMFFFYSQYFRVDKKRDKLERKVLDSQERAFWDVHRPVVCFSFINIISNICKKSFIMNGYALHRFEQNYFLSGLQY